MIYRDKINLMVEKYGDRVGTICASQGEVTFAELGQQSNALANGLADLGLLTGDRIALLCGNCHYYREMFWTAGKAGLGLVPVNTRLKPRELVYIINNSEAKALVISAAFEPVVEEIRRQLTGIDHFFCLDQRLEGYQYLGDFPERYSTEEPKVQLTRDHILWLQYTSGTTGLPKGAVHTQSTASSIIDICHAEIREKGLFQEGTRALQMLPSYSFAGVAFDLMYQWIGALTVIMERFDVVEMMRLIDTHRITDCHIVPVILNFLLNAPELDQFDLKSLKCITYGGSPMTPELVKRGIKRFGPIFMQDYGCSEAGALTFLDIEDHINPDGLEGSNRLYSCGKPFPGVDVKVLNEVGQEVKSGEIGELTTRSDMVMTGYWKLPEETRHTLIDGRFYTGDLCTVDADGYIYLKDRKKDMIISGGFNIYPFELESVLMEHPAVMDAAVVGIPDEVWGEAVCALVVLKTGCTAIEEELIAFMKAHLADYKKAKKVEFVKEIPRTLTGKILKQELREKYWEGRERKI
ncbi:MAG: AMP-binding protein [Deltaproteobacteria bacterium]|nr:AMP-binding protein [Deltaproteobacteria bacterium]